MEHLKFDWSIKVKTLYLDGYSDKISVCNTSVDQGKVLVETSKIPFNTKIKKETPRYSEVLTKNIYKTNFVEK